MFFSCCAAGILEACRATEAEMEKIFAGNAERLLKGRS